MISAIRRCLKDIQHSLPCLPSPQRAKKPRLRLHRLNPKTRREIRLARRLYPKIKDEGTDGDGKKNDNQKEGFEEV